MVPASLAVGMTGLHRGISTADLSGTEGAGDGEQLGSHIHLSGLAKPLMQNMGALLLLLRCKIPWCFWRQAVLGVATILPLD